MVNGFTGNGGYGQLGHCGGGNQTGDALPALIFATDFVPDFMGMGSDHSCFVSTNWSMICFGYNYYGQVYLSSI